MVTTTKPASEKQIAFIQRLRADRNLNSGQEAAVDVILMNHEANADLNTRQASQLIDWLMQIDKKPVVHEDGAAVSEGYYLQEDTVYKVVKAKHSDRLYAKALHSSEYGHASWDYAPGAMNHLRGAHRLTVEQAAAMGTRLGACVVCGKALTDPESVERGIGPVCMTRL